MVHHIVFIFTGRMLSFLTLLQRNLRYYGVKISSIFIALRNIQGIRFFSLHTLCVKIVTNCLDLWHR